MRTEIPIVVLDNTGHPVLNASVSVFARGTVTPQPIYQAATGVATFSNPVATDAAGRVTGWLERGQYDCLISATGLTTYTEPYDSTPAGDGGIDTSWIADGSVTAAKLAAGVLTLAGGAVKASMLSANLISPPLAAALTMAEGVLPYPGFTSGTPQNALVVSAATGWTINVGSGWSLIQGDDGTVQGMYLYQQAATVQYTFPTTVPVSFPRVDAVVIQWNDPDFTGRTPASQGNILQVPGTPTSGANLTNRSGAAAIPNSALWIADVLVLNTDTGIVGGQIADRRKVAGPAIWGEDNHRYRLGVNATGDFGAEQIV